MTKFSKYGKYISTRRGNPKPISAEELKKRAKAKKEGGKR
jgi:hypothetical protein